MFRKLYNLLAALAGLSASQLQPSLATGSSYATFQNGRYQFYGRANGASRRRKSNRLHLSTKTRNKHR